MNAQKLSDAGIVTQLAMVHTMLPKVKELIDQLHAEIEALKAMNAKLKEIIETSIDRHNAIARMKAREQ